MNKIILTIAFLLLCVSILVIYLDYSRKIQSIPKAMGQNKLLKSDETFVIKIEEGSSNSNLYAPKELKAEATATSVSLTWGFDSKKLIPATPEMNPYILRSGFRIYRDGFWYTDTTGELNTFTDTNLYPGESYTYTIAALTFDNKIEGLLSEPVKIETKTEDIRPPLARKNSFQTYLASGDSVTEGLRADKGKGWVDQFTAYLRKTNPQLKTINAGKTGTLTQDLAPRMKDEVEQSNPDLVTIAVGLNDLISGVDKSSAGFKMLEVRNNLEKIIDSAAPSNDRTVLLLNIYYQNCCNKDWSEKGGKDIAWNKMIKDLAYAKKVQLIDVYTPMKTAGPEKVLAEDLIHPSQSGHDIIANTVIKAFGPTNEKDSSKQ